MFNRSVHPLNQQRQKLVSIESAQGDDTAALGSNNMSILTSYEPLQFLTPHDKALIQNPISLYRAPMSSQMLDIPLTAIISTTPDQIASELGGEAVILNLSTGQYYGLNEVGARVWELIQQPCTVDSILHNLLEEYDVQPDVCKRDLTKILVDMKEACLIEVSDEQTA